MGCVLSLLASCVLNGPIGTNSSCSLCWSLPIAYIWKNAVLMHQNCSETWCSTKEMGTIEAETIVGFASSPNDFTKPNYWGWADPAGTRAAAGPAAALSSQSQLTTTVPSSPRERGLCAASHLGPRWADGVLEPTPSAPLFPFLESTSSAPLFPFLEPTSSAPLFPWLTRTTEEEPGPIPIPKTWWDTQTHWAISVAATGSLHVTLVQDLEDRRACPQLCPREGRQEMGISSEQLWLQVRAGCKNLGLSPHDLEIRYGTQGHQFPRDGQCRMGWESSHSGPSRTTPENQSTPICSSNAGNSTAPWQVKSPTFLWPRDRAVPSDTRHIQPSKTHSCYIFLAPIFSNRVSKAKGPLSSVLTSQLIL